jgi:hypothetical protein
VDKFRIGIICSIHKSSQEKKRMVEILRGEFAKSRELLDLVEEQRSYGEYFSSVSSGEIGP